MDGSRSQELDFAGYLFHRQDFMDQHQPPQHFSDPYCALLTISDARMANTLSVEPKEVRVMCYQNSS